jgi:hypothetical protein
MTVVVNGHYYVIQGWWLVLWGAMCAGELTGTTLLVRWWHRRKYSRRDRA